MSTSISQGLQSCLEPGLVEPRVLRLKLALQKSNLTRSSSSSGSNCSKPCVSNPPETQHKPQTEEKTTTPFSANDNKENDANGWSFLLALANSSSDKQSTKSDTETEKVYVHPMVKRSASMLSTKSLEMCTESLGSETGSDTSESRSSSGGDEDAISILSLVEREDSPPAMQSSSRVRETLPPKRLYNRSGSFPPPLTSVSSSSGLQVRSHREEGRLVLKAVMVSPSRAFFHAERTDGRLRLRLMNVEAEEEEVEEDEEEEEEVVEEDDEVKTEMEDEVKTEIEDEVYEGEEEEEEEEGETEEVLWGGDMEENSGNVGGEIGSGKLNRPSRCKENRRGNRVSMNWEPFLVAT